MIGPFCTPHFVCLNIGFWQGSIVLKWCIFNLSTFLHGTPVFLKKVFSFQKIRFKVKVSKAFVFSSGCHINTCQSFKCRTVLKIPCTVLWKNLCYFCWMKPLKKALFSLLKQKPPQICRKTCWKEQPFIFCLLDESPFLKHL